MLRLNNVEVVYDRAILVLKGISFEVPEQRIITLLGSNGAGKSTTLKAISGLLKPERGDITTGSVDFAGQRIDHRGPEEIVKLGITQVMEGRRVFDDLTTEENLLAGAHTRHGSSGIRADRPVQGAREREHGGDAAVAAGDELDLGADHGRARRRRCEARLAREPERPRVDADRHPLLVERAGERPRERRELGRRRTWPDSRRPSKASSAPGSSSNSSYSGP